MRISTYNINGVTARLDNLLEWLKETKPDIACLQELKTPDNRFPADTIRKAGYHVLWRGQPMWNGVAILSRGAEPVERRRALPGDPKDSQSRYIEAEIGDLIVACLYLPNGNPAPGPKFDYKLMWFARLLVHAEQLFAEKRPVILAGDYNVMPTDLDVYKPERWEGDALFRPEVREAYRRLLAQGWTDAIRKLHPKERIYTFWKYWRNSFQRDAGLRIDHLLLNAPAAKLLKSAGVDRAIRAKPHTSDHAPAWIELGTKPAKAAKKAVKKAPKRPAPRAKKK